MADDTLSPSEKALLVILMCEAREVPNAEITQRFGFAISVASREKLNQLGLIDSREVKRKWYHQLADKGWVRMRGGLEVTAPKAVGAALTLLHYHVVSRVLPRSGFDTLADLFALHPPAASANPDAESLIRAAYADLAEKPGEWVGMTELRERLRSDVDATLRRMSVMPGVSLAPESNQKTLSEKDRQSAVVVGKQAKHVIAIEKS